MSDEIPRHIDEESRRLESVPLEPLLAAETELPPPPEVAARSPKAV